MKHTRRTGIRQYKDYKSYKRFLREDFQYRCVYCTIHENEYNGCSHFHVDHFRPKAIFKGLLLDYSNLLYSCDKCNEFKNDIWPSDDLIMDGIGWLDPCEHDLDSHYKLVYSEGRYRFESYTKIGKWMIIMLALDQAVRAETIGNIRRGHELDKQILQTLILYRDKEQGKFKSRGKSVSKSTDSIEQLDQQISKLSERINNKYLPRPCGPIRRGQILHSTLESG